MNLVKFNEILRDKDILTFNEINKLEKKFYHSSIYYIKLLLEAKFPSRKFELSEIKELLKEVFPKEL